MESIRLRNKPDENRSLCIWTQAGVVDHKFCRSDYECQSCRFDKAMWKKANSSGKLDEEGIAPDEKSKKIVSWKDKLKKLHFGNRPCLHYMKRRIDFKTCTHDYRCENCEFDQFFDEQHTVYVTMKPVEVFDVHGFKVPQGYYLHRGHAWLKMEEGHEVRIGLDDFALGLLGPLDRVESPLVGKEVKQGGADIAIFRGEHRAKVLCPISGVVTAINPELIEQGIMPDQDSYSNGWVMRVHSKTLRNDLKNLCMGNEAKMFLEEEVDNLYRVIEEQTGELAADGGFLVKDIYGNSPQIRWETLVTNFLHT